MEYTQNTEPEVNALGQVKFEASSFQEFSDRLNLTHIKESFYFPKYFEIETVNACNARCVMCTIDDWEKVRNPIMSDKLFGKFLEEVSAHHKWVDQVSLNRDGEPTLDKNLHKKIKSLKDAGIKQVTMATNVQLLDEKRIHQYLDAGLDDIMVSIDGVSKKTFEEIRVNLNYETVVQNTLNLIKIRDQLNSPLIIRLRMIIMDSNKHEVQDWISFWKDKIGSNDQVYAKAAHTWGNQLNRETEKNIQAYADRPCIAPFSSMIIHTDGTVPMCSIDYSSKVKVGNFSKNSIVEIWNDEPLMNIRKLHASARRNEIDLCQGCRIWEEDRKTWS
jgi:radical SAM protein with 4Fe4S-binding SPASM domain